MKTEMHPEKKSGKVHSLKWKHNCVYRRIIIAKSIQKNQETTHNIFFAA